MLKYFNVACVVNNYQVVFTLKFMSIISPLIISKKTKKSNDWKGHNAWRFVTVCKMIFPVKIVVTWENYCNESAKGQLPTQGSSCNPIPSYHDLSSLSIYSSSLFLKSSIIFALTWLLSPFHPSIILLLY